MKKSLLVVALLLFATTAFAVDVTITATKGTVTGSDPCKLCPVTVGFTGLAEDGNVTGFALVLQADNGCTIDNIRDFNKGESKVHGGGYGIFPGKFRDIVNPAMADACMTGDARYNPLAPPADYNSGGYSGSPKVVVELGAVWLGDANKPANGGRGTLFTVDVNSQGKASCNFTVALEMTRGGVVKSDASAASVTLPAAVPITFASNCTEPNIVGMTESAAIAALTAAGMTAVPSITYEPNGLKPVNTVDRQTPLSGFVGACNTAQSFVVDTNCLFVGRVFDPNTAGFAGMTVTAAQITLWNNLGKPNCWCCNSQKRGNVVYTGTSAQKTDITDLAAVKNTNNYGKVTTAANACLDLNFSGKVDITDLARVKNSNNYGKVTGYGPLCK